MPTSASRSARQRTADLEQPTVSVSHDTGERALFTTLARTGLYLDALQRECLAEHGIAFTEYSVLRLLQREPKRRLGPSVLADAIVCTTGAMTKLVDRLERAELVSRERDPSDRRGVLVRLEPAGNRLANQADAAYRAGRDRVLGRLNAREADKIHTSLRRLLEALEADRREP
jgi:DNA-binding MarR family transcriptional regulator